MRILFVHQNFPGQFKHLAPALSKRGHHVSAFGTATRPPRSDLVYHTYQPVRTSSRQIHPWASDFETKVIRAEACMHAAQALARTGYVPDVIYGHPGWGELLFLRELWPQTPQIHYLEFFYRSQGQDLGFDPEFGQPSLDQRARLRAKNANLLLNMDSMDLGVTPTAWQFSTLPSAYQPRTHTIHDGIDTQTLVPHPVRPTQWRRGNGQAWPLHADTPVVTFVARNLEPYRGYHQFMRALPQLMRKVPKAQIMIVGGDTVSYGASPKEGTWKQRFFSEVAQDIDTSRVHFLDRLPYSELISLLRISNAHVYLTYPFVLSWSMLEAMSLGAPIVASNTAPVRDVIEHGRNGLLFDFFDPNALADAVVHCLNEPALQRKLGAAGRQTIVERYDLQTVSLPQQLALLEAYAA